MNKNLWVKENYPFLKWLANKQSKRTGRLFEECLSDVSLIVLENFDKFDPERGSITTFLRTVVYFKMMQKKKKSIETVDLHAMPIPIKDNKLEYIEWKNSVSARVQKCIQKIENGDFKAYYDVNVDSNRNGMAREAIKFFGYYNYKKVKKELRSVV